MDSSLDIELSNEFLKNNESETPEVESQDDRTPNDETKNVERDEVVETKVSEATKCEATKRSVFAQRRCEATKNTEKAKTTKREDLSVAKAEAKREAAEAKREDLGVAKAKIETAETEKTEKDETTETAAKCETAEKAETKEAVSLRPPSQFEVIHDEDLNDVIQKDIKEDPQAESAKEIQYIPKPARAAEVVKVQESKKVPATASKIHKHDEEVSESSDYDLSDSVDTEKIPDFFEKDLYSYRMDNENYFLTKFVRRSGNIFYVIGKEDSFPHKYKRLDPRDLQISERLKVQKSYYYYQFMNTTTNGIIIKRSGEIILLIEKHSELTKIKLKLDHRDDDDFERIYPLVESREFYPEPNKMNENIDKASDIIKKTFENLGKSVLEKLNTKLIETTELVRSIGEEYDIKSKEYETSLKKLILFNEEYMSDTMLNDREYKKHITILDNISIRHEKIMDLYHMLTSLVEEVNFSKLNSYLRYFNKQMKHINPSKIY